MNQYLTPEQRAQFEQQLAEDALTEQQKQDAFQQGVDMAQADMADAADGEPAAVDEDQEALRRSGFDSVQALLDAYETSQQSLREAEDALAQLNALARALENGERLAPESNDARSRRVQDAWKRRAGLMKDLEALLPEMAEYIMAHPAFALEEDGLQRAYDAVRADKYKSEDELLADPENVKRLSADPRVKSAVLTAHLSEIYKASRDLPAFIAAGGGIPAEADKPQDSMAQAKAKLEALLKKN